MLINALILMHRSPPPTPAGLTGYVKAQSSKPKVGDAVRHLAPALSSHLISLAFRLIFHMLVFGLISLVICVLFLSVGLRTIVSFRLCISLPVMSIVYLVSFCVYNIFLCVFVCVYNNLSPSHSSTSFLIPPRLSPRLFSSSSSHLLPLASPRFRNKLHSAIAIYYQCTTTAPPAGGGCEHGPWEGRNTSMHGLPAYLCSSTRAYRLVNPKGAHTGLRRRIPQGPRLLVELRV